MRKDVLILFCFLIFLVACPGAENAKKEETAATSENAARPANDSRQAADSPQTNAPQSSPSPTEPNAEKSPTIVNANGQNITYSTAGELEIVGSETQYDIILPTDILFDFDKHEIRPEAKDLLGKLKAHFAGRKMSQVHVFGHTDSKGSDQYNAVLSQKRAVAVQKWLKENTGVYAMALGMGEREPLAPNENADGSDNPENRQRNRRVTIRAVVYPDIKERLNRNKR